MKTASLNVAMHVLKCSSKAIKEKVKEMSISLHVKSTRVRAPRDTQEMVKETGLRSSMHLSIGRSPMTFCKLQNSSTAWKADLHWRKLWQHIGDASLGKRKNQCVFRMELEAWNARALKAMIILLSVRALISRRKFHHLYGKLRI